MRGEYAAELLKLSTQKELPPRARRILYPHGFQPAIEGTTSACAENTPGPGHFRYPWRNYLRVRGEYVLQKIILLFCEELPPRARRILVGDTAPGVVWGTTSACAENTLNELGLL